MIGLVFEQFVKVLTLYYGVDNLDMLRIEAQNRRKWNYSIILIG
jgi:hypothetical protein